MKTTLVTTVLAQAASYDLTDLATVRTELSFKSADTSDDAWLARAITRISKSVMNATNRVFAPECVQDVFDIRRDRYQVPAGADTLQLSRWPVLSVLSVVQFGAALGATVTLVEGADFRTDAANGQLLRLDSTTQRVISWEPLPVTVIYVGGFGAMVVESHSVPAPTGPYTVTASQAADFSCDGQVLYASGAALARVAVSPAHGQYSVEDGVYTFNAADAGQALTFSYATYAAPDDLEDVTLELVTGRFRERGRDPKLIQSESPNVGTQRWWFGGAPGQTSQFPPDIQGTLSNYHMPVAF